MSSASSIPQVLGLTTSAAVCASSFETASSQSTDLRSSSSSLESTPRAGAGARPTYVERKVSWADCDSDSDQDIYDADGDVLDPDDDSTSAAVTSKSAKRRHRRKRAGQHIGNMVPEVWNASPQGADCSDTYAKTDCVPANPCRRAVVTINDLGLGVIMQPPTSSVPQRHSTLALAHISKRCAPFRCHSDGAPFQVQDGLARSGPSCGTSQMTTFPAPEKWIAVAMPVHVASWATSAGTVPLAPCVGVIEAQETEPPIIAYAADARLGAGAAR
jgi:hypothetical protein